MAKAFAKDMWCHGCNKAIENSKFYDNKSKYHKNGKMHYCKDCCRVISAELIRKEKDFEIGLRAMCAFFHVPFNYMIFDKLKVKEELNVGNKSVDYMKLYMEELSTEILHAGAWDDIGGNIPYIANLTREVKLNADDVESLNNLQTDWGAQKRFEDYLILMRKFDEYTEGKENLPIGIIKTIRFLCEAELRADRAKEEGDSKTEQEYRKQVMEYFKRLKMDEYDFNGSASEDEKMLENWAFIHENIHPLTWEEENLKDRLGFERDYENIVRSMGNKLLGKKEYYNLTAEDINRKRLPS